MLNQKQTQNSIYEALTANHFPQLTARFIALKLQAMNNHKIKTVKQLSPCSFKIETDKAHYSIETHVIDLPDAKIKQI